MKLYLFLEGVVSLLGEFPNMEVCLAEMTRISQDCSHVEFRMDCIAGEIDHAHQAARSDINHSHVCKEE